MEDTTEYIERSSFRSIDSMLIRDTGSDLLDLDRVRAHIDRAIERRRYTGATEPIDYLLSKGCLVADGDHMLATQAGILAFGREPHRHASVCGIDFTHFKGCTL